MAYNSNFRSSELTGTNPVTITNEAQVVVDLSYKSAGSRGVLLSEAPLKESPSTIVMVVGGTTFTEVDISAFTGAANTFAVEYASNSGVILLPPGTATGTATTTTYKGLGSVATIESKRYNPDGLVGAPSVSFENDPDTGLYLIGANNMGFAAGGVQVGQISATGISSSVGIQPPNLIVIDQNPNNTTGGTIAAGTWTTRVLNTIVGTNNIPGSSLATNRITLPSGTYYIDARIPGYAINRHKARLYNITDVTNQLIGTSEYSRSTEPTTSHSFVLGFFTISATKVFEIQHIAETANANGLGLATNFSVNDIYTVVKLWKLA